MLCEWTVVMTANCTVCKLYELKVTRVELLTVDDIVNILLVIAFSVCAIVFVAVVAAALIR